MGNDKTGGSLNPNLKHPESCLKCWVPPNALVPPLLSGWGGWVPTPEVLAHDAIPISCVGEAYVVQKSYTAVEEDELTLKEGDAIEVIHKLLDGWWVVR